MPSVAPSASAASVLHCEFPRWYPAHRRWTIRSRIIPLSEAFVAFLNADGLVLPPAALEQGELEASRSETDEEWSDDDDDDDDDDVGWDLSREIGEIREALRELGGAVVPKLNWSCPRDACWISSSSSIKCSTVSDVLLLMKASDFVAHDLSHAFDLCSDAEGRTRPEEFVLVLRQWTNLVPGREFRCFVANRSICAISQRDHTNFHESLLAEGCLEHLRRHIEAFFDQRIRNVFPDDNFVLDVYVDGEDRVFVIDFNPFFSVCDSLLFSWSELELLARRSLGPDDVEFRVLQSPSAISPSSTLLYQFPKDLMDAQVAHAEEMQSLIQSLDSRSVSDEL